MAKQILHQCPREITRDGKVFWYVRATTKKGVEAQRKDWKKHKPHLKTRSLKIGDKYCFYVGGVGAYSKRKKK